MNHISEYNFLHGITNAIIHTGTLKMLGIENWYWATKLPMLFIICGLNMFLYIFGKRYLPPLSLFILILLVCFDATVISYSTSLRSDICLMTFYSISALFLYGYFKENNKKYLFGSGIAAGFTMLTFMQGIPILPSAVVCLLVTNDNFKKAIKESALFISTVLAVISPYLIWIFVDETRTEIFILQHNFADHHDDPLLIAIGKALCVPFSSMWGNGRSFTSLFVIASILFSLANIREKEGRFWLSLLFIDC